MNYKRWRTSQSAMTPVVFLAAALSGASTVTGPHMSDSGMSAGSMSGSVVPGIYLNLQAGAVSPVNQLVRGTGPGRGRGLAALAEVRAKTSKANWNGAGAPAIGKTVVDRTRRLLKKLPADLAYPRITPDDDGSLVLDWKADRDWVISVSIPGAGELGYAGLSGGERQYGVIESSGDIPPGLIDRVRSVLTKSA